MQNRKAHTARTEVYTENCKSVGLFNTLNTGDSVGQSDT